jgi:hypothetical protein
MLRVHLLGKAAECERAIEIVADPDRRVVLSSLRSVWIALANKERSLRSPHIAGDVSTIAQIHAELMSQPFVLAASMIARYGLMLDTNHDVADARCRAGCVRDGALVELLPRRFDIDQEPRVHSRHQAPQIYAAAKGPYFRGSHSPIRDHELLRLG